MKRIQKDFMVRELRRLALCALGLTGCLLVLLRFGPRQMPYQPLLWLGMIVIISLAALRSVLLTHAGTDALTDQDSYLLEQEYTAPHPIYRVWQGEIHLMQSFIVCRSRGRLLVLPTDRIERAELRFDRVRLRNIPAARLTMDTGRTVVIGFSLRRPKESEAVFAWLAEQIGWEKVLLREG